MPTSRDASVVISVPSYAINESPWRPSRRSKLHLKVFGGIVRNAGLIYDSWANEDDPNEMTLLTLRNNTAEGSLDDIVRLLTKWRPRDSGDRRAAEREENEIRRPEESERRVHHPTSGDTVRTYALPKWTRPLVAPFFEDRIQNANYLLRISNNPNATIRAEKLYRATLIASDSNESVASWEESQERTARTDNRLIASIVRARSKALDAVMTIVEGTTNIDSDTGASPILTEPYIVREVSKILTTFDLSNDHTWESLRKAPIRHLVKVSPGVPVRPETASTIIEFSRQMSEVKLGEHALFQSIEETFPGAHGQISADTAEALLNGRSGTSQWPDRVATTYRLTNELTAAINSRNAAEKQEKNSQKTNAGSVDDMESAACTMAEARETIGAIENLILAMDKMSHTEWCNIVILCAMTPADQHFAVIAQEALRLPPGDKLSPATAVEYIENPDAREIPLVWFAATVAT